MSGGGKSGSSTQTTKVKLPKVLRRAARENIALADDVGRLGFMPNLGPTVAGFSPGQRAAMDNTNQAAQAFGMQSAGDVDGYMMGESFDGGSAYGAAPVYEQMLAGLTPEQRAGIMSFVSSDVGGTHRKNTSSGNRGKGGLPDILGGGSGGSGGGGMWSDGMTASEVRQHQADRTFGRAPADTRSVYDQQMAQYTGGSGNISMGYGNTAAGASSSARSGGRK